MINYHLIFKSKTEGISMFINSLQLAKNLILDTGRIYWTDEPIYWRFISGDEERSNQSFIG